ncbi:MAG: B12-binding domain-containing radical SAM protein [bacterium]
MKNLKILFINPPYFRLIGQVYAYLPLGICSLAAVTKEAGYETIVYNMDIPPIHSELFESYAQKYASYDERDVIVMNCNDDPLEVWKELESVLTTIEPDIIGITALTPQVPVAKKIASLSKIHKPQATIIMGGVHASFCPEELLREEAIDYVFSGEGEEGILEFLTAIRNKASLQEMGLIKGLSYKDNGTAYIAKQRPLIDVNKYPMPSRELFIFPERFQPKNMGLILTGRGCPFKCKFCSSPNLSGYTVRQRSLENILEELEYVMKRYTIHEFMFWEDTFVANKNKVSEFCSSLKKRKLDIAWRCHTRLDTLNEDILDTMLSTSCKQINVGVETGSEKTLRYLNKSISLDRIIKKMDLIRSRTIAWSANFMIGYPEELPEDVEDTIDFIENEVKNHIAINTCIPYPGSQFFDDSVALGIVDNSKPIDWTFFSHRSKYACFCKYITREQLNRYMDRIKTIVAPYMVKTPGAFSPCERI